MPPRSFERNDGGLPSLPVPSPRIDQQYGVGDPQLPRFHGSSPSPYSTPFGEKTDLAYRVMASPQAAQSLGNIAGGIPEPVYVPPVPLTAGECVGLALLGVGVGAVGIGVVLAVKAKA